MAAKKRPPATTIDTPTTMALLAGRLLVRLLACFAIVPAVFLQLYSEGPFRSNSFAAGGPPSDDDDVRRQEDVAAVGRTSAASAIVSHASARDGDVDGGDDDCRRR